MKYGLGDYIMSNTKTIQIYGDSILKGAMLNEETLHYYTEMAQTLTKFESEFHVKIGNKSKFGCTITKGISIIQRDLEKCDEYDYAIIEYGGNDCNFRWDEVAASPEGEHLPATSPEDFEQTLRLVVDIMHLHGICPVLMTLPPVDAEKYLNFLGQGGLDKESILHWLGDVHMIYRFQEMYSGLIYKVARQTDSMLVDVRSRFLDQHNFGELTCRDGLHPSKEGHQLIYQAFAEFAKVNL